MPIEKTFLQELVPSSFEVYQYIERPFYEGIDRLRVAIQGIKLVSLADHVFLDDQSSLWWWDRFVYGVSGLALMIPPINFVIEIFRRNLGIQFVCEDTFLNELNSGKKATLDDQTHHLPESERR